MIPSPGPAWVGEVEVVAEPYFYFGSSRLGYGYTYDLWLGMSYTGRTWLSMSYANRDLLGIYDEYFYANWE